MFKQVRVFLCIVALLWLSAGAGAQAAGQQPETAPPAYTRLSDDAILKMGLSEFSFRYGKEDLGARADDRLHYFAGCLARRNDRRARRVSDTTGAKLAVLRARLTAWDERRFTPAQRYVGGMLEQGHQDASMHVEREQLLETLTPLIGKKRGPKPTTEEKEAAVTFRAWVKQSAEDSIPLPEQLADGDIAEKRAIRLNYAAWYALLKDEAQQVEAAAKSLPSPAAARVFRYAVAQ